MDSTFLVHWWSSPASKSISSGALLAHGAKLSLYTSHPKRITLSSTAWHARSAALCRPPLVIACQKNGMMMGDGLPIVWSARIICMCPIPPRALLALPASTPPHIMRVINWIFCAPPLRLNGETILGEIAAFDLRRLQYAPGTTTGTTAPPRAKTAVWPCRGRFYTSLTNVESTATLTPGCHGPKNTRGRGRARAPKAVAGGYAKQENWNGQG